VHAVRTAAGRIAIRSGAGGGLVYKGQKLKSRYYIDLVVEDRVIVELKTVVEIVEVHKKQVLTQLRLAGLRTGLIINFNVEILTDGGVKRVVNPAAGPDYLDPIAGR
jgi:GxxExxY protein